MKTSLRCHAAVLALSGAVLAGLVVAGPSSADCCLQPPSPARAPFHVRFHEPLRLGPVLSGQVSSEGRARYRAEARILVRHRVLVRQVLRGVSDRAWSPLRIRLTRAERRAIRAAAHGQRSAVLTVRVSGRLPGSSRRVAHFRSFVVRL